MGDLTLMRRPLEIIRDVAVRLDVNVTRRIKVGVPN